MTVRTHLTEHGCKESRAELAFCLCLVRIPGVYSSSSNTPTRISLMLPRRQPKPPFYSSLHKASSCAQKCTVVSGQPRCKHRASLSFALQLMMFGRMLRAHPAQCIHTRWRISMHSTSAMLCENKLRSHDAGRFRKLHGLWRETTSLKIPSHSTCLALAGNYAWCSSLASCPWYSS